MTTSTPVPTMRDILIAEIRHLMALSKTYRVSIQEASTKTKVDFYKKKLKKNNNLLANMLLRLDHLTKKDASTSTETVDVPSYPIQYDTISETKEPNA